MTIARVLCPRCPMCFEPPAFALAGAQRAFCGVESCPCLMWDPTKSVAENRRNAEAIDLLELTSDDEVGT